MRSVLKPALALFILGGMITADVYSRILRNRIGGDESVAIGDLRSLVSSEVAYSSMNDGAYGNLECLASPTQCGFAPGTAAFIDANIASLRPKQGYARSFLAGAPAKGKLDPGLHTFVYVATPVARGTRGFAVDQTGLICYTTDGTPPPIKNGALAPDCTPLK